MPHELPEVGLSFGALPRPSTLALALCLAFGTTHLPTIANPTGGVAIHGSIAVSKPQPNTLLVTTQNGAGTSHSAVNWQSFSIPAGSTTRIEQPSAASMSINRVVTNTPSQLFGTLSSNGKVVLVNQAGIAVGAGALVDTAGFTASAVGMTDAEAISGRLRFSGDGLGTASGALTVQGNIIARGGDVVLIAPSIELAQTAVVESQGGSVILAAGQSVEVTGRGLEGITLQVQAPTDQAVNLGTLKGDAVGIFAGTLRHSGLIQAVTATMEGGRVVLKAAGDAYVEGNGRIEATGTIGGQIDVFGQRVAVTDQAVIDASGQSGGGTIRVGGDYQGLNLNVKNASMTHIGALTNLKADSARSGNGGRVIVWADDTTWFMGNISARGGADGGDGGFVETSGKRILQASGIVDASAVAGNAGAWLLDPNDITISNTSLNVSGGPAAFTSINDSATLAAASINTALNGGTDVTVTTDSLGSNSQLGTITVAANISKTGGGAATLKLIAKNNVVMNSSINITSTSGSLGVVLNSDSDGDGVGTILMNSGSFITSNGGNVLLGGGVNAANSAVGNTASGGFGISLNNATINAGAGSVTMRGTGSATAGAYGVSIAGGSISSTTGDISITGTGGAFTAGNGFGVHVSGTASINTTSGNLTITGNGAGTGDTNHGIKVAGGTISSTTGAINLTGTGAGGTSSGSIGVLLGGANTVSVTSSGSSAIQVSGTGNGLGQGVTLDSSSASVTLGGSSHTGDLTIIAGGVGANKDFSILGANAIVNGTGNLYIKPTNAATSIGLGTGAGDFNLSAAEIATFADGFSRINIGSNSQTGTITVGTSTFTDSVKFETSTGGISLSGDLTSTGNTVKLQTNTGLIQQTGTGTGTITAGSLEIETNAGVNLSTNANAVTNFSATKTGSNTNQINYWNTGALTLGAITTPGSLSIKTSNAAITQNAPLSVNGGTTTATFEAGTGDITLTSVSNDFNSVTVTSGGNVSIRDANAMTLNSVPAAPATLLTSLNVRAVGNLTLGNAAFSVSGTGDAMIFRTDGTFNHVGTAGSSLQASNGRWLIYLKDPGGHTFKTSPGFKQYNAAPGDTILGSGNGILYNNTTPATLTSSLLGAASKDFDGTTSIDLAGTSFGTLSGYIDGDQLGQINGGTGVLSSSGVGTGIELTVSGMTLTGVRDSANAIPVYGYKVNSVKANIATVKASAASAAVQSAGDVVTTFAEKLDALVKDAQDSNGDPKDKKDERAKEAVVVEADICRP